MTKTHVKIGDILEIPLNDGRKTYGQYVYFDKELGGIMQVFDLIVDRSNEISFDELKDRKLLFPPIFIAGLYPIIRAGEWKIVEHTPVKNFTVPSFVSTIWNPKTGEASKWFLWNGEKDIPLEKELPEKYKRLEFLIHWSPYNLIERIRTGKNPYKELIMKNKMRV
jgi:hypothetical protein